MTKILIEIDTDTQRVVPVEPTQEMIDAMPPVEEIGYWAMYEMYESAIAAAPQPEPVDVDLRRDAERWRKMATLMFIGNVELNQDEDGGYSISVDPVENILGKTWCGNSPDEAIDFVPDWSQGEQK